jgi:formylglycine-generating enzyme required for sulfatase activity
MWTVLLPLLVAAGGTAAEVAPPRTWVEPVTGMSFVELPAGRFRMGSSPEERGREPGETPHEVLLPRPFLLGRTEVTQAQWEQVMGSRPSWFAACGPDCPVERVSWYEVQDFVARLSALSGLAFRLPTEAEWEYACRAGSAGPFAFGRWITSEQANFDGRYPYPGAPPSGNLGRPAPVASYPPNAWGLFDLHGNVWEWVADEVCPLSALPAVAPFRLCGSGLRGIRGGSWAFDGNSARCALRYTHRPEDRGYSIGFRVARSLLAAVP